MRLILASLVQIALTTDAFATERTLVRELINEDDFPLAKCNDGTTPAFYWLNPVANTGTTDHNDDWIIFLEGGGSCSNYMSCHARASSSSDGMKMGTGCTEADGCGNNVGIRSLTPQPDPISDRIAADGIFSNDANNPFRNWNIVILDYCSSDKWLGMGDEQDLDYFDDYQSGSLPMQGFPNIDMCDTIYFRGHLILEAAIDMLLNQSMDDGVPTGISTQALPSLRAAHNILFAGGSAGGQGARQSLDWFSDKMQVERTYTSQYIYGAMEASWIPGFIPDPFDPYGHCLSYTEISSALDPADSVLGEFTLWNPYLDETCKSLYEEEPWRCLTVDGLIWSETVETPFYAFQNQRDAVWLDELFCPVHPQAEQCLVDVVPYAIYGPTGGFLACTADLGVRGHTVFRDSDARTHTDGSSHTVAGTLHSSMFGIGTSSDWVGWETCSMARTNENACTTCAACAACAANPPTLCQDKMECAVSCAYCMDKETDLDLGSTTCTP
jgi:hypothetical protein